MHQLTIINKKGEVGVLIGEQATGWPHRHRACPVASDVSRVGDFDVQTLLMSYDRTGDAQHSCIVSSKAITDQ